MSAHEALVDDRRLRSATRHGKCRKAPDDLATTRWRAPVTPRAVQITMRRCGTRRQSRYRADRPPARQAVGAAHQRVIRLTESAETARLIAITKPAPRRSPGLPPPTELGGGARGGTAARHRKTRDDARLPPLVIGNDGGALKCARIAAIGGERAAASEAASRRVPPHRPCR